MFGVFSQNFFCARLGPKVQTSCSETIKANENLISARPGRILLNAENLNLHFGPEKTLESQFLQFSPDFSADSSDMHFAPEE